MENGIAIINGEAKIVDDNACMLAILKIIANKMNCTVKEAATIWKTTQVARALGY